MTNPEAMATRAGFGERKACVVAAFTPEHTVETLVAQQIARSCRVAPPTAQTVALADLGSRGGFDGW